MNQPFVRLVLALTTLTACTNGDGGPLRPGNPGGKGDGGECRSDAELIVDARRWLAELDPSLYGDREWIDDISSVRMLDDLGTDGVPDAWVSVGMPYAGTNVEVVIYMTVPVEATDYACLSEPVGHAAASDIWIAADRRVTNDVRDLIVYNKAGCTAAQIRYQFEGGLYAETDDVRTTNLCP